VSPISMIGSPLAERHRVVTVHAERRGRCGKIRRTVTSSAAQKSAAQPTVGVARMPPSWRLTRPPARPGIHRDGDGTPPARGQGGPAALPGASAATEQEDGRMQSVLPSRRAVEATASKLVAAQSNSPDTSREAYDDMSV
jgi:hypothetical protein